MLFGFQYNDFFPEWQSVDKLVPSFIFQFNILLSESTCSNEGFWIIFWQPSNEKRKKIINNLLKEKEKKLEDELEKKITKWIKI